MLELHILSGTATLAVSAAIAALLIAHRPRWGRILYYVLVALSFVVVGSGSVLAIATSGMLTQYCTYMGAYLVFIVLSLIVFHYHIFHKHVSFLPLAAQVVPFGVTIVLLMG